MRSYRVLGVLAGAVFAGCIVVAVATPAAQQYTSAPASLLPPPAWYVYELPHEHRDEPVAVEPKPAVEEQLRPAAELAPRNSQPATVCGDDFDCFRACTIQKESGGNYQTNTGNGYYGAWQFHQPTWDATTARMGLDEWTGVRAHEAPADVQDSVARALWESRGNQPWGGRC